jgi:hypothetical protein
MSFWLDELLLPARAFFKVHHTTSGGIGYQSFLECVNL